MDEIHNEMCPFCHTKNLTLTEDELDIPYFGKTFIFGMKCSNCDFEKSDVEAAEEKEPCKITFTAENEEDLKVRVVKSSAAIVKMPGLRMSMEPGPDSLGFISNIEGLLERFKKIVEEQRDTADDPAIKKTAKNLLKKMWKITCGDIPLKVVIEDPSGNSAIISEKAVVEKLKK
jgi:zinc finger protein